MEPSESPTLYHRFFLFSIALKGIDGVLECMGAALLFLIPTAQWGQFVDVLFRHELWEDPSDVLVKGLVDFVHGVSPNIQLLAALYLAAHGLLKVYFVWQLYHERRWAFPVAIVFLFLFVAAQLYRYAHTHQLFLLTASILDLIVVFFIWREWQRAPGELSR